MDPALQMASCVPMNGTPISTPDPSGRRRGKKPAQGQPVIDRAFALLNAFDAEHRALPLADLARRAGMPRSTALRLARSLVEVGALERRDDDRFTIGLHLLEVASLAPRGHGLRAVAMPFMEDLFHLTGQHVLLAVPDGGDALLVERLSSHDASPIQYRVGGRLPLTSTGVGLVLLAFSPQAAQRNAIDSFVPDGNDDIRDANELRKKLAGARRGEYVVAHQVRPFQLSTAAAPIHGPDGVVAALSVVTPSSRISSASVPMVRAAARAISRHMRGDVA